MKLAYVKIYIGKNFVKWVVSERLAKVIESWCKVWGILDDKGKE